MKYRIVGSVRECAIFRGREYEGGLLESGTVVLRWFGPENPEIDVFSWNERAQAWTAVVPMEACTRVYTVRAYAKYHGYRVNIESIDDSGVASVYFDEGDMWWAEENGFDQIDKYVFFKKVPDVELYDLYEDHEDELFDSWRESTFVRPPGGASR